MFISLDGSRSSRVFGGSRGLLLIFVAGWSVAIVAKCMFRENNIFTLVFYLTVAEVARFSGVPVV